MKGGSEQLGTDSSPSCRNEAPKDISAASSSPPRPSRNFGPSAPRWEQGVSEAFSFSSRGNGCSRCFTSPQWKELCLLLQLPASSCSFSPPQPWAPLQPPDAGCSPATASAKIRYIKEIKSKPKPGELKPPSWEGTAGAAGFVSPGRLGFGSGG